ncbi:hypothetical protein JQ621_30940 [Bradyrhizobium manausense]|uniref:hypothetical protein n=1 Tax=Bradyrhizobium manausense TaxID=989370 RepID=UPI001BA74D54|nr:hypothetical protein [Bradyrhizobium manausense]MBR1091899.1 hypothetical protein [Bradyrhizobium manausense]
MDVQRRYWQELVDLKRDAIYIDLYQARTEIIDRNIGGLNAITSSASIGAWVIWKDLAFLWAAAIACSQVLQTLKEFLPYKKRLRSLNALSPELNGLCWSAENDWFKVSRGLLTEAEIHDLHMKLKKKKQDALQKAFPASSLPLVNPLIERAGKATQDYFQSYFYTDA